MIGLLQRVFAHIVKSGTLEVIPASGERFTLGDGSGPPVAIRFTDTRIATEIALDPTMKLGEAYMDGRLIMERGTIYDLVALLMANLQGQDWRFWAGVTDRVRAVKRTALNFNPVGRARRNAQYHYDLDGALYDLFLDPDRQYSCAYFPEGVTGLDDAQLAKKRHIASKLLVEGGSRVLDIGCGWGGLALYLAQERDVRVHGVTLSNEQLAGANRRARDAGLDDRLDFTLSDYREIDGRYDRIVSVGMLEHVGLKDYDAFFARVHDLLDDDGVAVIHAIGRWDGPSTTNPFIQRYIFPGGHLPSLSEVVPVVERAGLIVTDVEILRLHYARTLRQWRERFVAHWDEAAARFGEPFCRMWEMYLAGSEAAFRYQGLMVFQMQLSKDLEAVPLTRDYMFETEARLRERDAREHDVGRIAAE